jgi:uncharacterized protein YecE (DUF72 family)
VVAPSRRVLTPVNGDRWTLVFHIGTSGWQYQDWRGGFYPAGCPERLWLSRYAESFSTVELNSAFYRLPATDNFRHWAEQTPPGFVVAVKASRYLTHVRRLADPAEPVARFLTRARGLGQKLGPVLLQLPPTLTAHPDRLDETLKEFPAGVRVVVEPRHPSWWRDDVREVLAAHGAALCWADRGGRPTTPLWRTADFGYLRLHAGRAAPWPSYGRRALDTWLHRLRETFGVDGDGYAYFNNDHGAAAVRNAATMAARAAHDGLAVAAVDG